MNQSRVERAIAAGDVEALVRVLGYPTERVEVEVADWARCGVEIELEEGARLARLSRVGHVEILAVEAKGEAGEAPRRLLDRLTHINHLIKYVVFYINKNKNNISVHSRLDGGRHRRLDLRLDSDRDGAVADILDRVRLLELRGDDGSVALTSRIDAALDRDRVTSEFFRGFRDAVRELGDVLGRRSPEDDPRDHALLVLSRILFLRFLQERGWLDRDRAFLAHRLEQAIADGESYFDDVLRPLFFGCLNTPWHKRRGRANALGDVPYLNGGLFQPTRAERRVRRYGVPNELMSRILRDVFDRFAFSLSEDDEGVHVDPEMLGRVFESLMESDERAKSGSFYTPRAIVDVLTRRAVVESLAAGDTSRARAIRDRLDGTGGGLGADLAEWLLTAADDLTIIDPACGSGAFLLSALGVVERLVIAASEDAGRRPPARLRQRIVERNLFGVDLKAAAVRLCELRLWLAIISDPAEREPDDLRDVRPLPNLDRNILQGNSLLGPLDFMADGRTELYRDWRRALARRGDLVDRYRTATPDRRPALARQLRTSDCELGAALCRRSIERDREEIRALEETERTLFGRTRRMGVRDQTRTLTKRIADQERLLRSLDRGEAGFFAYEVHFANVLDRGGFDVVVGNPPWVRRSRIDAAMRKMIADRYRCFGRTGGLDQSDLCVAFVERALDLARGGGVVSMVVPGKLASARFAGPLRSRITSDATLLAIDDWRDEGSRMFDADVFPLALTVRKGAAKAPPVTIDRDGHRHRVAIEIVTGEDPVGPWCLAPRRVAGIVRQLQSRFGPLEDVLGRRPVMGVKTGANRAFFLENLFMSEPGVATEPESGARFPLDALARCVRGRDVRRWKAAASTWMLWPPAGGWHEVGGIERWASAVGLSPERLRLAFVRPEHLGIKVVWKDLSRGVQAVVLPDSVEAAGNRFPLVPNQTLYALDASSLDEAYLVSAMLNSTIVDALAVTMAEPAKDAHYRYFGRLIGALPWPRVGIGTARARALVRLARRAHQGADVADEVDVEVSAAFGLEQKDLATLREFVTRELRTKGRAARR